MPQSKEQKQQTAMNLIKMRAQLSPAEQLAKLDIKFGKGQGAKKERARLNKMIGK